MRLLLGTVRSHRADVCIYGSVLIFERNDALEHAIERVERAEHSGSTLLTLLTLDADTSSPLSPPPHALRVVRCARVPPVRRSFTPHVPFRPPSGVLLRRTCPFHHLLRRTCPSASFFLPSPRCSLTPPPSASCAATSGSLAPPRCSVMEGGAGERAPTIRSCFEGGQGLLGRASYTKKAFFAVMEGAGLPERVRASITPTPGRAVSRIRARVESY